MNISESVRNNIAAHIAQVLDDGDLMTIWGPASFHWLVTIDGKLPELRPHI